MSQDVIDGKFNIDLGNDLVPSGSKPLPEAMLTEFMTHMTPQWVNSYEEKKEKELISMASCKTAIIPMMTSSNGNIFPVTGHLCGNSPVTGEFPAQRPVTRSFDVFFDLCLNERLNK